MDDRTECTTTGGSDDDDENNGQNLIDHKSFHGHDDSLSISKLVSGLSTAAAETAKFAEIVHSWDFSNDESNSCVQQGVGIIFQLLGSRIHLA